MHERHSCPHLIPTMLEAAAGGHDGSVHQLLQYPTAVAAVKRPHLDLPWGGGEADRLSIHPVRHRVMARGVDINHPGPLMEDQLSGHSPQAVPGGPWDGDE